MKQLFSTAILLLVAVVATAQYVNISGPTSEVCNCEEYSNVFVTVLAYGDQPFIMLDMRNEFLYECPYYTCTYNIYLDKCQVEFLDTVIRIYDTEYGDFTLYLSPTDCKTIYKYEREFEGTLYSYSY